MNKKIKWAEPSIDEEEIKAVKDAVASGWVGGNGPVSKKFAIEFARTVEARYAIPICNGTCGLMAGLLALKEKYGNLFSAVPTWTFIATANTAKLLTNQMDLIDCEKETFNINPKKIPIHSNITIPVDVGGLPVDYDAIAKNPYKSCILADSAESLGASYKGKKVGSQADIHLFSLHAAKIATSGEGGVLTTNDKKLYEIISSIINQGYGLGRKPWEYYHERIGFNFRMTEMQAAIGLVQIKKLPIFLRKREEFAKIYKDIIEERVVYQEIPRDTKMSWFLFSILVERDIRDRIIKGLISRGIEVRTWLPIHLQPPYKTRSYSLPNAEYLYQRVINLPIHNNLSEDDVIYIAETVRRLLK